MTVPALLSRFPIITAALPALVMAISAAFLHFFENRSERSIFMAEQARLSAAAIDLRLERLLNLTTFCASSPAIILRMDPASFKENCGRYADMLGAWVVVVALGETHEHVINTRPDAPSVLPSYPRSAEHETLLDLEQHSKATGRPGIAEVFTGKIYTGGIVSAGQWIRLSDGREAMLYVSVPASSISDQLAKLATVGDTVFALVDPSRRIVGRSSDIEHYMFAPVPIWFLEDLKTGLPGASLGMAGPPDFGGTWDAGFYPLSIGSGWMAVAVQPALKSFRPWNFFSFENTLVFLGLAFSAVLLGSIAYRNRTIEQLRASEQAQREAERRNQEKSRLLASFAHDVRSPLVSMIGSLSLMEENKSTDQADLNTARSSAEELLQLVDDILELSFLGSENFELHPSPVDLRKVVSDLEAQIRIRAQQKGLSVKVEVESAVPTTVLVDRLRLQQVLGNLLTNAVKYTEIGGVTLRVLSTPAIDDAVDLTFVVTDTGVGISHEDMNRVFREFGRLDRPIDRRETGTGLGLAICKRILRAMESALKLDSTVGKGSEFSFVLRAPVLQGTALVLDAKPLSGITILYAEDEAIIRNVTSRQLADAGATVIEAEDGFDALAKLQTVSPDVFLVDIQMPRLDGVETIRNLLQRQPERRYPIFVLTSHISGPKAAEARAVGADEVFTKPVQILPLAASLLARRGHRGSHTPDMGGTSGAVTGGLVELERLRLLLATNRQQLLNDYLPDFASRMREDIALLGNHIAARNLPLTRALSHRCLGICLVLGAQGLGKRLKAIEDASEAGNADALAALGEGLDELLLQTVDAIRRVAEEAADTRL